MKALRYCLRTAHDSGVNIHPSEQLRKLGIDYKEWHSWEIADCIVIGVDSVPDDLPVYLEEINYKFE